MKNPFELFNYQGPKYFCDREDELKELMEAFDNRRNQVLFSDRRLGKSHLIQHFHQKLNDRKDVLTIYLDVLNTKSDKDFINKFVTAVIEKFKDEESYLQKVLKSFQRYRPVLSVDAITGNPEIKLDIRDNADIDSSMKTVMDLLKVSDKYIQIAIDEFQVIESYKEDSVIDATLRSFLISSPRLHLLFSGSEQHILAGLFSSPTKPLFGSTAQIRIGKIGYVPYFDFIKCHFEENGKEISDNHIHEILAWTEEYTFYTHFFCNQLYSNTEEKVDDYIMQQAKIQSLKQFEMNYLQLEHALPSNQWDLRIAIAREGNYGQITSKAFLSKYGFSGSSALQAAEALLSKQLLHEKLDDKRQVYFVNDIFFKRWAENMRS